MRLAHLFTGRAPKTKLFPHDWFDSPNIHFFTVDDFESLVQSQHWTVEKRIFLRGTRQITVLPNLLSRLRFFWSGLLDEFLDASLKVVGGARQGVHLRARFHRSFKLHPIGPIKQFLRKH